MRELKWAPGSISVIDYMIRPGGPSISPQAVSVYICLFSYMGYDFRCHPSISTIAQGTRLSPRTVMRRIEELAEAGLIEQFKTPGNRSEYKLLCPWGSDTQSPVTESRQCQAVTEPVTESHRSGDPQSHKETQLSNPTKKPNDTPPNPQGDSESSLGDQSKKPSKPKKTKNPHEYSEDFLAFWELYPRKISKAKAWRNWRARLNEGVEPADMIAAARHYAQQCAAYGTEERFIKHPTTFLGRDRDYEDWVKRPTLVAAGGVRVPRASPGRQRPIPIRDPSIYEKLMKKGS